MKDVSLGSVVDIILGGTPKTSVDDYWNGNICWLTPGDIGSSKHITETEKKITQLGLDNSNTKLLIKGDVVISARGSVGKLVEVFEPMAFNQSCYAIRSKDTKILATEYVFYLMQSCVTYLKQNSAGAVFNAIIKSTLEKTPVRLPDLNVQKKVSVTLSNYDNLIENNRRRIQLLEESARLLYKEWFVHLRFPSHEHVKITDGVPDGWEKLTAYEVMEVLSGGTPKTKIAEYWDGDIPFFTPKDTTDCAFTYSTEKMITEQGLLKCNSRLYPKYTLFITARGTVGKLSFAQRAMAMNQSCYALVGKEDINQQFLYCSLKASIEQFKARASGAVFDAIVVDTFKLIPFLKPTSMLIEQFTDSVEVMFGQIDRLSYMNRKLEEARDILLPRLMNGELSV